MLINPSICHVPNLLPDELLYSLIGRLGAMNALGTPKARMELFFGVSNLIPTVDLPTGLDALQKRLGMNSPWCSTADLIDNGTIYPYHRPFLTGERHRTVEKILFYGKGKRLKTIMGRVANRFGAAPILRYCSACSESDVANFGVPYWHRSHQLPGVSSCILHGLDLYDYSAESSVDKQRLILAPALNMQCQRGNNSDFQQKNFAVLSNDLLTARLPPLEAEHRQRVFFSELIKLGFGRKSSVDHVALSIAVREHYQDFAGFIHRERLLSTELTPLCWLRALVDRPSRSLHPVCYLLLIGFLFKTVDKFIEAVAHHEVRQPSSATAKVDSSYKLATSAPEPTLHALVDAQCSCRKAARALGLSVTTVVKQRQALGITISERPKYLNSTRLAPVIRDLKEGVLPQKIASKHHVSLSTVYRLRAQFSAQTQACAIRKHAAELKSRRTHWMQIIKAQQLNGLKAARSVAASTYTWLYRHDREWLHEKTKTLHSRRVPNPRVNWQERDSRLAHAVSDYVEKLMSQHERPRISRTLMTHHLDDTLIRANIDRLPRLQALLECLEETPLSYQLFRIDCAIALLAEKSLPLVEWRIRRFASIRRWTETHAAYAACKAENFENEKTT